MGTLIKKRLYLDFNATSPLAPSVREWLSKGEVSFCNPSSLHSSGRRARKFINDTILFLYEQFSFGEYTQKGKGRDCFDVIFHSGATEGINTLIKGFVEEMLKLEAPWIGLAYSPTDHASVKKTIEAIRQGPQFKNKMIKTFLLPINERGELLIDETVTLLKEAQEDFSHHFFTIQKSADNSWLGPLPLLINFTYVNNETGVFWPLQWIQRIKQEYSCFIHVDAVQAPGKIKNFWALDSAADAYTFSGHKFGALKGVGFSWVKKNFPFHPLVYGGEQQSGRRSGTENTLGVYSLKLALEELQKNFHYEEVLKAKLFLEDEVKKLVGEKGVLVAQESLYRNATTFNLLLKGKKADVALAAFDLEGIEISSGSACSSGSLRPSEVLLSMGFPPEWVQGALRFSFSPHLTLLEAQEYWPRIAQVLQKFL